MCNLITLRKVEEVDWQFSETKSIPPDVNLGDHVEQEVIGAEGVAEEGSRQQTVKRIPESVRLLQHQMVN